MFKYGIQILFMLFLANSNLAYAGDYASAYHGSKYYDSNYAQPLSLSLKVRLNGTTQVGLRNLIERRYNIDTRDYRIRSVSIGNKSRYGACAELVVGRRSTGPIDLRRGVTHMPMPGVRTRGRWMLNFENARVRRIRVDLEPIHHRFSDYRDDRKFRQHDKWGYRDDRRARRERDYYIDLDREPRRW